MSDNISLDKVRSDDTFNFVFRNMNQITNLMLMILYLHLGVVILHMNTLNPVNSVTI